MLISSASSVLITNTRINTAAIPALFRAMNTENSLPRGKGHLNIPPPPPQECYFDRELQSGLNPILSTQTPRFLRNDNF